MATPYVTIVVDEASSTQDLAVAELRRAARPVLIVASRQTSGRGRSGSQWWQAPRAVAASLALHHGRFPVDETLPLAAGLAVRWALAEVASCSVSLKWPNDLEVDSGKVGGILVESDGEHTVVGCGVNLWWPDPPSGVAAAFVADPGGEVGELISGAWAERLLATEGRWDRSAYIAASSTLGAEVTWEPDGRGRAVDVDERGGLVVIGRTGRVTLRSGTIRTIRRA